jgi:hypothetical protein
LKRIDTAFDLLDRPNAARQPRVTDCHAARIVCAHLLDDTYPAEDSDRSIRSSSEILDAFGM